MSELARRRDARDVWVSRSHLHAAAVGGALMAVLCFGGGFLAGRHQAFAAAEAAREERTMVGHVPGRELLALLAEVERSAVVSASEAVVYPDILGGKATTPMPSEPPSPSVSATVPAPPIPAVFTDDPTPAGRYTVEVGQYTTPTDAAAVRSHLCGLGLDAWWALQRVDGQASYKVAVGGYADEVAAVEALPAVLDAASAAPLAGVSPKVAAIGAAARPVTVPVPGASTPTP